MDTCERVVAVTAAPEYRPDLDAWWVRDPAQVRQVLLDPETFDPANALTAVSAAGSSGTPAPSISTQTDWDE